MAARGEAEDAERDIQPGRGIGVNTREQCRSGTVVTFDELPCGCSCRQWFFMTRSVLLVSAIILGTFANSARATDPDPAFFETHVRPVLVERCYKCHSST